MELIKIDYKEMTTGLYLFSNVLSNQKNHSKQTSIYQSLHIKWPHEGSQPLGWETLYLGVELILRNAVWTMKGADG